MESIVGSIVTACVTGGITLIGVFVSNSKTQAVQGQKLESMKEDICRLEAKQDKHNSVIERMYKVESDMKTAFRLIDNLRDEIHKE